MVDFECANDRFHDQFVRNRETADVVRDNLNLIHTQLEWILWPAQFRNNFLLLIACDIFEADET